MRSFFPLSIALLSSASAQCPTNSAPHFDCVSAGGNTQITLFADAELSWDRFHIPAAGSLDIASSGGLFASRNLVTTFTPSSISGPVTADGPFTLITTYGLQINPQGSITAPSLILSTLPALSPDSYQGSTRARQLINNGTLTATSGDLSLLSYQTTNNGDLSAPSGKITLIATGSETISGPNLDRSPTTAPSTPLARVSNRGSIQAPIVEIYSEGSINNTGSLIGNQSLTLHADSILHQSTPGSVIITSNLTIIPIKDTSNVLLQGVLIRIEDGNNPGGISTSLGLPDLASGSFTGKKKTKLLPTQFSSSTVNRSRLPSAVAKRPSTSSNSSSNSLATRGSSKKKTSAKKRSFFGIVTPK